MVETKKVTNTRTKSSNLTTIMPKVEREISDIRKYFVTWVADVSLATALDYFDINKISEGTCQQLLNLIFEYRLQDLNREKKNFPGIDLGDREHGVAFQITSRTDATKITDSLKTFTANDYSKDFPKGIRFFIIGNGKRPSIKTEVLSPYTPIFDIKKDVYFPADLIRLIVDIYYSDALRFNTIKQFLKTEFGSGQRLSSIVQFKSAHEKLDFYKRLFTANHERLSNRFVPFSCKVGEEKIPTDQLPDRLFSGKGGVIIGPSGCGKSILARRLALTFLENGLPVLLQAKYYHSDLNTLFEKEIRAYGFDSGADFFAISRDHQLSPLFLIDGLNECKVSRQPKLLLELENVIKTFGVQAIITTQTINNWPITLGLNQIVVSYPEEATKKAIAASYSGKKPSTKLDPILQVVSSSLEAQMIGEIGSAEIDKVSRFTLFEIFIKSKLGDFHADGFLLLSNIASVLSRRIIFNLSERSIGDLLRSVQLKEDTYQICLSAGLLERQLGKVSFAHEMFFNFFVADSVVRFATDADEITIAINAPKNSDKKLLIIGSIEDTYVLGKVLSELTDIELLTALYGGEGGNYCQLWVDQQLNDLLAKIKEEIQQLGFEFGDNTFNGVQFKPQNFRHWTSLELALVYTIPSVAVRDHYLQELFDLIGLMDDSCSLAVKEIFHAAREKNISARSAIFSTTYIGVGSREAAITRIFSTLQSGFVTFRTAATVSEDSVRQLLKNKSLKHGQFYFLLLLLRYDDKLRQLYPYVKSLLKNWRGVPYHLIMEVLQQIGHCYETEEQRVELIEALNTIHGETHDIWLSTSLFDALGDLGALVNDAADYEATVLNEIRQLMEKPDNGEFWDRAAGVYYAQFDHPYDAAYYTVIQQLSDSDRIIFLRMALQGYYSSIFTIALIKDAWRYLNAEIAPYLARWTEAPLIEPSFPQDSLTVFLLAHLLLAKSNYPLVSRYASESEQKNSSIFAGAEIYYWLNRADGNTAHNTQQAKDASRILFASDNAYAIATVWQLRHNLGQSGFHQVFEPDSVITIEIAFPEQVVAVSRAGLKKIGSQHDIFDFSRGNEDVNKYAIGLLGRYGSILDLDVLRPLTEHSIYGESAVRAMKELGMNN